MEKRQLLCGHRRHFVVAKLLPLICIFFSVSLPSHRFPLVESFVLRGPSSLPQLGDILENLREDDGDGNDVDFIDQLSPLDIQRLSEEEDDGSMTGYGDDFADADDEPVARDDGAEADFEAILTEQMMDARSDENDKDGSMEDGDGDDDGDNDDDRYHPDTGKIALNKSQLHELFDLAQTEENRNIEDRLPRVTKADKKARLSKNEVAQLFEMNDNENTVGQRHLDSASLPPLVIVSDSNASSSPLTSDATPRIMVVPTVKVTTIEELVQTVGHNQDDDDDEADDGEDKEVTLDVKEERLSPDTNEKAEKEWLIELTQPEEDVAETDATPEWITMGGEYRGSKKSKRSVDSELTNEKVAKRRAVRLLTAYIQMQEDENRHLTEALNLATRGQTERTDRYIDDEVQQLKQAVSNEQAIHRIRQMIRAEEDNEDDDDPDVADDDENDDVTGDADGEDGGDDDDADDDGGGASDDEDSAVMFGVKRFIDLDQLDDNYDEDNIEVVDSPVQTFEDADEDDEAEREEEISDEDDLLRERLRQIIIENEMEKMQQAADQEQQQEDDADNPIELEWTPSSYRNSEQVDDARSTRTFNPFTRDIVELYRHGTVPLSKRKDDSSLLYEQPQAADYYNVLPTNVDEIARAKQEAADVETLKDILQLGSIDFTNDVDDEFSTETGVCPAVVDLTDGCLVARERGLVLDDEALQLCNRHQLCYSCGNEYGMTPDVCDRGYLSEADLLCTEAASVSLDPAARRSRCKAEAAGLFVIMLDGHRSPSGAGYAVPPLCRQRCAYNYIVGSPGLRLPATKH